MGTDIHVVAQVRDAEGVWRDQPTGGFDICGRNYTWFTFLCGVRQGLTTSRGIPVTPIAPPRGAPEGFGHWMGYGVTSWVTLAEILEHEAGLPKPLYPEWPACRVGPIDELERLFRGHPPDACRIVFGFDSRGGPRATTCLRLRHPPRQA